MTFRFPAVLCSRFSFRLSVRQVVSRVILRGSPLRYTTQCPIWAHLIRHAYQKSRSILSFYNKMRFAFFSRSKALYYFIERRNCNLARYDNC